MRHLVRGHKLGRTASHRKATLMALSVALLKNERIKTTLAKARALRSYVEPIINRSKEDNTHNRSHVFRHLRDNQATSRLFDEIAPMVGDRPGGYTRIIKLGVRSGDGAEEAIVELVDFNDTKPEMPGKKKRRTRRGRSGGAKKAGTEKAATARTDSREAGKQSAGKTKAETDEKPKDTAKSSEDSSEDTKAGKSEDAVKGEKDTSSEAEGTAEKPKDTAKSSEDSSGEAKESKDTKAAKQSSSEKDAGESSDQSKSEENKDDTGSSKNK